MNLEGNIKRQDLHRMHHQQNRIQNHQRRHGARDANGQVCVAMCVRKKCIANYHNLY